MISLKKLCALCAFALTLALPAAVSAADHTVADWKFSPGHVVSGSLESGDAVFEDSSGNGNDLQMRPYQLYSVLNPVSFSDDCLFGSEGSVSLNGDIYGAADFVTVDDAPINKATFPDGYTIEILYKMPSDWTTADRWQNIIARQGSTDKISEGDKGTDKVTMMANISNCKEIQFIPVNASNQNNLSSSVWSVAMDKAETWYSIVITYDNKTFSTYLNGCESFRNIDSSNMKGLYADPNDGRFRIGSRLNEDGDLTHALRGYIQEIRISDSALTRSEWLVSNPESYLGQYGDNRPFEETGEDKYNFVFLPDMQNTVKFKPNVLETAMNWMVENKDFANIKGVVSLGDNVQDFWEKPQWQSVSSVMSILAKGGIRTLAQPGNHDTGDGSNYWYFDTYFGPNSDFHKLVADYTEVSPSGTGFVMDAPAGSFDYKIVTIDMYHLSDAADVSWLRSVLTKYTKNPVIIVSHDIQNCSDTSPNATRLSTRGQQLFDIVKEYDNVFMMVGGHSHGYGVTKLTNAYGHDVVSVLADYQFSYNGGNAIFKFAEFDEKGKKMHITSFSPYSATLSDDKRTFFDVNYMTGTGHDDTVDFDFETRLGTLTIHKQGENLIENNSFEKNTDGWTNNNNGSVKPLSDAGWVRSADVAHDGEYSLRQVATAENGAGSDLNLCTFFPIEAGKIYSLSYWEYSGSTNTGGWNRMHGCFATDSNNKSIGSLTDLGCGGFNSWRSVPEGEHRDPDYYQGWTQRSYIFDTTNAPNAKYIVLAYAWGGDDFYIDDFSLNEISLETYTRVVLNSVTAEVSGDKVNVTLDYNIDAAPDALLLAAGFTESGEVVSLKAFEDGKAVLDGADKIVSVKAFCWNGFKDIMPLTQSVSTTPTKE